MGTLNSVKNRIRTLGLTSEDDEVAGDSPMAASARAKALDKYDMAAGTYSGPGAAISNAVRAVRGDLDTEANARKEMGAKAAREADAEVKRETRGKSAPAWVNEAKQAAKDAEDQPKLDRAYEKSRTTDYAKGGKVSSASARADGIAQRGKTRGTMIMCGGGYAKGKK